jgi:hypothetical protein
MKFNLKQYMHMMATVVALGGMSLFATGCSDDDMSKSSPDYDPRYTGEIAPGEADYTVSAEATNLSVTFKCDMAWEATVLDAEGNACDWASVSPVSGEAGEGLQVVVAIAENLSLTDWRSCQLVITTEKGGTTTITIAQEYKVIYLDPNEIADYDKYICPQSWNPHFENGPEYMLRQDSYYSWHRMRQSEHFFVFWSPEFGDDPNSAENQASGMYVDVDDLLKKAEQYFDTNINKLGMAVLGQGKSNLDKYKMQIYLIYQDEWLATGSGYDNEIGALWVNPSTCHPVGSTIAHEIGHSFQYQVYCDKLLQGAADDAKHGFRYGFYGVDGSGNGGCGYWEQCAQWQAQQDYPNEQFESYNFDVWLNNCHRHFHHEWQRYASYWLQSYWVAKHGVEAYGRIWRESEAPEDAIMTYSRIYNNNDYATTREELFDYAARMATFDIDGVREYASETYQDNYNPKFYYQNDGSYQISYANCPGATGFNVIPLTVPNGGGQVSVAFTGLNYGASLCSKDKGVMVDGDGKEAGKTTHYNAVGGADNMGWRYGFVAYNGSKRTYGSVGKDKNGTLSFTVPSGTTALYLVVQGSPEIYMSHGWDEVESNDPQFPYSIKLTNTDLKYYEEDPEFVYTKWDNTAMSADLSLPVSYSKYQNDYLIGNISIATDEIANFFGISVDQIADKLLDAGAEPAEGKIAALNYQSNDSYSYTPTANNGYWLDANGDQSTWGDNGYLYWELPGASIDYGQMPGKLEVGKSYELRPTFVYTTGGTAKTLYVTITLKIVD